MEDMVFVHNNPSIEWDAFILKPYYFFSAWRYRIDRRLNEPLSLSIQLLWDSPYRYIRHLLLPIVVFVKRFLHLILRQLDLEVFELQSSDAVAGEKRVVIYVGDKRYLRYWSYRFFGNEVISQSRGRVPIWRLDKLVETLSTIGKPVIFEIPMLLKKWKPKWGVFQVAPANVQMVIRYEGIQSEKSLQEKFRAQKENLKRSAKAGFKVEPGNVHHDFEFWYEHMLVPLALNRHGFYAETGDKGSMKKLAQRKGSELYFVVNQEGIRIAGSLSFVTRTVYHGLYFGLLEGNYDYAKKGALAFLYHYSILEGFRRGCQLLDGGEAMALLSDGVLQHKLLWGYEPVESPWSNNCVVLWAPEGSPDAIRFVEEHPLVSEVGSYLW